MFAEQTSKNVSILRDFKTTHPRKEPSATLERRLGDQNVFFKFCLWATSQRVNKNQQSGS